jgi:hypothetical protein
MALARSPLCEHCRLIGQVVAAQSIDHVVVPNGDVTLQRSLDNLMPLCHRHHSMKTRNQDKGNNIPYILGRDDEWRMVFSDGSKKPNH